MKLRWNRCIGDIWKPLESLRCDAPFDSEPTLVIAAPIIFPAEKIEGLAEVICKLEAAVSAICNK